MSVVAFFSSISFLLFGTFAGVLADRVPRQKALLLTREMMLLQAALLAILVATGRIEVWHLIALSLWRSLVEDRMRGRIVGFYPMAFLGTAPLGHLAAGVLAREFGGPLTFVANGILCVLVALWFWQQLPKMRVALQPDYERLGMAPEDTWFHMHLRDCKSAHVHW